MGIFFLCIITNGDFTSSSSFVIYWRDSSPEIGFLVFSYLGESCGCFSCFMNSQSQGVGRPEKST